MEDMLNNLQHLGRVSEVPNMAIPGIRHLRWYKISSIWYRVTVSVRPTWKRKTGPIKNARRLPGLICDLERLGS